VLLVMNERGARGILASKVKLGGDASVAAGPSAAMRQPIRTRLCVPKILSYSRARGLFCWSLPRRLHDSPDNGDNRRVYGRRFPRGKLFSPERSPCLQQPSN